MVSDFMNDYKFDNYINGTNTERGSGQDKKMYSKMYEKYEIKASQKRNKEDYYKPQISERYLNRDKDLFSNYL